MYYWLLFYIPAMAIAVNLPTLINSVFTKDNLDPITRCYMYLDPDTFQLRTIGFWKGQRENMLGLIYTLAMMALIVLAFFFANHWWMALIALISGSLVRLIKNAFWKLRYGTSLYYIELYIEPILLFLAYYFLFSAHNPYI